MHRTDPVPALKRQVGLEIARLLDGWRAADVAHMLGTEQARISDLRRGKLERFSLDTLIRYATRLRRRVVVAIEPAGTVRPARGDLSSESGSRTA